MKKIGYIEKVYRAAELLNDFCDKTACTVCPIEELCDRVSKQNTIGREIMECIRK